MFKRFFEISPHKVGQNNVKKHMNDTDGAHAYSTDTGDTKLE